MIELSGIVKKIEQANVYDVAVHTQLEKSKTLGKQLWLNIYHKREDLQPINSFKIRGAYNKIVNLSTKEKEKGIFAASAGNHAQGVALSAMRLGLKATIVMPTTTPEIKISAVRDFGAKVILHGDSYSEAADHAKKLVKQIGSTYIHPFDDKLVIAGQGTVGKEILQQLPDVDYVFVPVGGGGLLAGVACYIKHHKPSVKIIGVEPEDSNAMQASIRADKRQKMDQVGIFADGVAVKRVGEIPFQIAKEYVDDFITVTTDELCAAIKAVYNDTRSIPEPAGALAIAGVTKTADELSGNIVAINSGANMTFERLQFVAERTLLGSGRESLYSIKLPEKPGALRNLVDNCIASHSITEFNYRKNNDDTAEIFVGIMNKSDKDRQALEAKLKQQNYMFNNLSNDDIAKTHIRHMVGGKPPAGTNESIFEFSFPERPGALSDFLESLKDKHNISLFHYRYNGGDMARVLIGLEDIQSLSNLPLPSGFQVKQVKSKATELFL